MSNIKYFDRTTYQKYVPNSVFGSPEYLEHYSSNFGGIQSENIKLAFFIKKTLGIKRLTICDFGFNKSMDEKEFSSEMNEIFSFLRSRKKISIVTAPPSYVIFPYELKNTKSLVFGTVIIDIKKSEEELFSALHTKHRAKIRKALKEGVTVKEGDNFKSDAIKIVRETLIRENTFIESEEEFLKIDNVLSDNIKYFVAYKNDIPQGAAIVPYDSETAFFVWGGSKQNPSKGATNLMHWEVIKHFKSCGLHYYDLVGMRPNAEKNTKYDGLKRFKTGFGGRSEIGFLFKTNLKPINASIFKLLLTIKNRAIPRDIIDKA
jgi:lipid II:glycine glycyltransferase (peptidoglycan interpeptide bridge formation enzyme)